MDDLGATEPPFGRWLFPKIQRDAAQIQINDGLSADFGRFATWRYPNRVDLGLLIRLPVHYDAVDGTKGICITDLENHWVGGLAL